MTPLALLTLLSTASMVAAQATPQNQAPPYQGQPQLSAPPPAGTPQNAAPPPAGTYQGAPPPSAYPQPAPNGGYQEAPPPAGYTPQPSPLYQTPMRPSAAPPGAMWRPAPRPRRGMMIAGISILGGAYLIASSIGVEFLDRPRRECDDCKDIAPWLFIPVVGPFISMSQTDDDWGFWMLGMLQTVGAGLTIGGIVRYRQSKQASDLQQFGQWKLPGNRLLTLDMSTSNRFAGPRMRLDF